MQRRGRIPSSVDPKLNSKCKTDKADNETKTRTRCTKNCDNQQEKISREILQTAYQKQIHSSWCVDAVYFKLPSKFDKLGTQQHHTTSNCKVEQACNVIKGSLEDTSELRRVEERCDWKGEGSRGDVN